MDALRNPRRLAATILLGGSVRASPFSAGIGRSPLELPCGDGRTLLDLWRGHVAAMVSPPPSAVGFPVPSSPAPAFQIVPQIHVLADQEARAPAAHAQSAEVRLRFDRDPAALRGTGGLLRDICAGYAPDDYVLVANATQILLQPLAVLFACLAAQRADVALIAHRNGTPATLMMVRCACLRELPEVGFFDMKEQALPLIGLRHVVKVMPLEELACCGIRTAKSYVGALKAYHRNNGRAGTSCGHSLGEDWRSDFQIQEEGANVQEGARLHNSVVLRGATVGRNSVLVRCVVCPGAVIPPSTVLVDKLVTAGGIRDSSEAAT